MAPQFFYVHVPRRRRHAYDRHCQAIKTMKLYHQLERVDNELRELGVPPGAKLDAEQLLPFE